MRGLIADLVSALLYRVRTLFRRARAQQELEDEIRFHIECETEKHLARGMTSLEATRLARLGFGSVESWKEESRSMWGFQWIEHVVQDLRYATRRLRQRHAFTVSVIGVLALGVGATTAMFSAVDAALLRPLPFERPHELVRLRNVYVPSRGDMGRSAARGYLDVTDLAAMNDLFTDAGAYASGGLNLSDPERPIRVNVGVVTANFFDLLGVRPVRGRAFLPEERSPDAPRVAVVSHALWMRHFGGRDISRQTVPLDGQSYQVVGVMPPGFEFPDESDLWIPMSIPITGATYAPFRGYMPSAVFARMAPGLSVERASARLLERWEQRLPAPVQGRSSMIADWVDENRRLGSATSLHRELVGDRRTPLLILLGATGFLLVIACANVTNLLLSDGTARQREIAVRHVLGASRGRVVRQLLAESVLLAMAGTIAGIAFAPLALRLMRVLLPEGLAGVAPAQIDLRVLAFAAALAILTGITFGLLPALRTTRRSAAAIIKGGSGHGATAEGSGTTRRLLVAAELALTLMLLVGAGLMLRSFRNIMALDLGMNPERVATLEISLPDAVVLHAERLRKINAVIDRLASAPGIDAAGAVDHLPLRGEGGFGIPIRATGMPQPAEPGDRIARSITASGGYFRALDIPMLDGRTFTTADDSLAPPVAIVSRSAAERFWPGVNAVGRTFRVGRDTTRLYTVIGVAADVRVSSIQDDLEPQVYFPIDAMSPRSFAIVARGALPPEALLGRLTDAVRAVDPAQAVYNVRTMEDVVGSSVAPRRVQTILIGAFAALALVLAAFGVYAVVAYGVTQRSRELGIRAALGATRSNLVSLVAKEMLWVTALGIIAGLAGAWALARVLSELVYGVDVHDVATFAVVPIVLIVAAALATFVPARRATRVDPIEVMRAE